MNPRYMELGVNLATGLVVVSVAVALASLTWRLTGDPGGLQPVAVSAPAAPAPAVDLSPVVRLAPFGAATAEPGVDSVGASIAGLQLRGIVRASPSLRSVALIGAAGARAEPFVVGQALPGGGMIDAINTDHVLVRLNGRQAVLAFPQRASAAATAGVAAVRAAIPSSALGLPPIAPAPVAGAGGSAAATGAAIEEYRDRIAASPQTLVGALGASATPQGYRIGPSLSPQMRAAGLAPGDVVEKVNGVQVGDAERDRRLFDEAVASGRARVEVLRDGRRLILSFPLR